MGLTPVLAHRGRNAAKSTYVAVRGVPSWEQEVFTWLHDMPRAVDYVLWMPMQAGSAWAPPVAAFIGWRLTKSWRPTVGALVAGWGGWWLAKLVKAQVERGRPSAELPADAVRDTALTEGLGFVSGHSTVAFACAAVLSPYLTQLADLRLRSGHHGGLVPRRGRCPSAARRGRGCCTRTCTGIRLAHHRWCRQQSHRDRSGRHRLTASTWKTARVRPSVHPRSPSRPWQADLDEY